MLSAPVALILANGVVGDPSLIRRRLERIRPHLVVAADGGLRHAACLNLEPSAIVGDLDSLAPADLARAEADGITLLRRPENKDETDLELALLYAFDRAAASAIVIGAAGGRLDMTVASVMLLLHPAVRGRRVELWVGAQTAYLLTPPGGEVGGAAGDHISLLPLGGTAAAVATHGLAFPLRQEDLPLGPARGISNRISDSPARVEFSAGALLVVHSPGGSQDSPEEPWT